MVILDTNIIIDHLRQRGKPETALMRLARIYTKESIALSIITVQELYEGTSTRDKEKEDYLLATITPLRILPYTYEIAQLAGEIARDRPKPIEFADATIAATAIINGAGLLTFDRKDFAGVKDLEFFSLD